MEEGEFFAIETFGTTGKGYVREVGVHAALCFAVLGGALAYAGRGRRRARHH